MGALHIAGFEIPVIRDGSDASSDPLGGGGFGVTGRPIGGHIATTEQLSATTKQLALATAVAIESLCRANNGVVWHCDNSIYSSAGLGLTGTPTFDAGTKKFGTHAISVAALAGDFSVCTVGTLYTISAWVKVGAGAWEHEILRSDGAKWVDAVRNDGATLHISVATSVFTLDAPSSSTTYFDEIVWLPFKIADDWGADWPQDEVFSALPGLDVTGDLLAGYRINDARCRARIAHKGYAGSIGGIAATVQIDIVGPEREVDA